MTDRTKTAQHLITLATAHRALSRDDHGSVSIDPTPALLELLAPIAADFPASVKTFGANGRVYYAMTIRLAASVIVYLPGPPAGYEARRLDELTMPDRITEENAARAAAGVAVMLAADGRRIPSTVYPDQRQAVPVVDAGELGGEG